MKKPTVKSSGCNEKLTEKPIAQFEGQNGNIFNLIGIASRVLKKAGQEEKAEEMTKKCFKAGSYTEALAIIADYVEIV